MNKVLKIAILIATIVLIFVIVSGILLIINVFCMDRNVIEEVERSENSKYFIEKLQGIPREFPLEEAVNKGYFVYDCIESKLYGKEILDKFVENAKKRSER